MNMQSGMVWRNEMMLKRTGTEHRKLPVFDSQWALASPRLPLLRADSPSTALRCRLSSLIFATCYHYYLEQFFPTTVSSSPTHTVGSEAVPVRACPLLHQRPGSNVEHPGAPSHSLRLEDPHADTLVLQRPALRSCATFRTGRIELRDFPTLLVHESNPAANLALRPVKYSRTKSFAGGNSPAFPSRAVPHPCSFFLAMAERRVKRPKLELALQSIPAMNAEVSCSRGYF